MNPQSHSTCMNTSHEVPLGGLPPLAAHALARAATAEARNLGESWVLCTALLAIAMGCVAWSVPSPSAGAPLALLCLVLIALEHHRARSRFRRALERVGEAHDLAASDAKRAARALAEAWDASS